LNDQRGEVTAELVVLTPVLVFMIMLCVHVAAWSHTASVATSVAARTAYAQARHGALPGDGQRTASDLIAEVGLTVTEPVQVQRSPHAVDVRISLGVPAMAPGLPTQVSRHSVAVVERAVGALER
jgi:hypothetical protein